jgi:murein DD-endopeptidase MepM/ murein hydrolase activator NlpD
MVDPKRFGRSRLARRLLAWFPERQLLLRSDQGVRLITLSTRHQLGALATITLMFGWTLFATGMFAWHGDILSTKNRTIAALEQAGRDAQAEIDGLRRHVAGLSSDLDHRQAQLRLLNDDNAILSRNLASTRATLSAKESDLAGLSAARETLRTQMVAMHAELQQALGARTAAEGEETALSDRLIAMGRDIRQVIVQRDEVRDERRKVADKANRLELALDESRGNHVHLLQRFGDLALGNVGEIEKAISLTGLDVNRLLDSQREETGKGGPFIPAFKDEFGSPELRANLAALNRRIDRWDNLNALLKALPMVSPLEEFQLNSSFGTRNDPINELTGIHEGVDLGAAMRAKVRASAPGRVTFAGWKGRYGRLVEVDHGLGVITRYAHLERINVRVGQKVGPDVVVGLLGNSGRSTGPHLHYEVVVGGRPRDPMKFIKAGRYVLKDL